MTDENFRINLNKELSSLGNEFIILLNINSKDYLDSVLETIKFMTDKGMGGVYLTSARPYDYMIKRFEKYNIDTKNLFFVDVISGMAGRSPGEEGGGVFIENPCALEEIGMWINILMDRIDVENKFLIVDSLSTLMIYNDVGALKEFSQVLANRLRLGGASGIFVSIDMEINMDLCGTLTALCDKTIKV